MNRSEKAAVVDHFGQSASAVPFIVVTEFRGTTVAEINQLRRELEKNGMRFQVIKNTLARRAFGQAGIAGLDGHLKGMTGIVLSSPDGNKSAKILRDLLAPLKTVQVRAGYFDGGVLEGDAVKVVAELPGREELLGMLLATLQEGPRQLVSVVQAPARDLLQLLKNYENKLTEAAG